jgi:hypothetical protein
MSAHGGPNIVEDGLVLALDAANVKSFRGEPTTNLLNTNLTNWSKDNGSVVTLLTETYRGNPIYRVTFPAGTLPRIHTSFSYTTSQPFTGHLFYRYVSGQNSGEPLPAFFFREVGFGTTYTSTTFPITTEFTFRNITHTFSGNGTSMFLLYRNISATSTEIVMDFCMPQLENKPYPTPFVNGTRGATVATGGGWADRSGNSNHGELVNGPTFDSSNAGSLSFDGIDDYITLSNPNWSSVFNNTIGNNFSLRCIIKPTNIGTHQALISQRHGDAMSLFLLANGKVTLEMDDTSNRVGTNTVLQNNNWYDITVTFENNTSQSRAYYYVNGQFERDELKWDGNGVSTNNNLWIGWQSRTNYDINPTYFNGEIAYVQIYNRALTAEEVLQNYNATKGRYGL